MLKFANVSNSRHPETKFSTRKEKTMQMKISIPKFMRSIFCLFLVISLLCGFFIYSAMAQQLQWKFLTGYYVYSSPAIGFDGTIYVGSWDYYLYAINPTNGTQKWKFPTGNWAYSSPAIGSDGTIYVGSGDGYLYAIKSTSMGLADSNWPKFRHDNQNTGRTDGPAIVVMPTFYDYGDVKVGEYKDKTFVVKNVGAEILSVISTMLIGDDASEFSIQSGGGSFDLNPGETHDIVVRFEPHSVGSKYAKLRIDSNDPNENPYYVTLISALKWKFITGGRVDSSPAIGSDGTIYVVSSFSDKNLYAINSDGTLKWKFIRGASGGEMFSSSPAIGSDGTIYVGSDYLYAINPNGTLKWKFQTGSYVEPSPAIGSDGTIYVGSWDDYLYAINPDGTLKWKFITGGSAYSSPAIGCDGTIYVGSLDSYLYAINPDGMEEWKFPTGGGVFSSPAIGSDGTIYVGSYECLYAINPDGTQKWKFQTGYDVCSSPAIDLDGTIYIGSWDDYLYAINPDGTQKWKFQTGDYFYLSSPAIGSDGTIYVGSADNCLYAINPDGTQKWKFQASDDVHSSPAIDLDGTIYVGSDDGYLYALNSDSMGLADSHWPKFHHDNQNTGRVPMESPLYGDVTGDGSVTALDAAFVLQACVGLITLTPEQEERANVSGEGGVTAYDAALIMQYVVGLLTKFPVEGGLVAPALTGRTYTISVGKICTKANERIVVPISVDDTSGILSGKLSLTYDAAYLNPIGVRVRNRFFPKNSVSKYNVKDGVLEISFADAEELKAETGQDGNHPLLFVEFEACKTSTSTIPLTLSEAYLNEGLNIRKVDGWLRFKPGNTALLPNFPNPFNPDTWIPYQLKEPASVVIRIYNVVVFQICLF